MAGLWHILKTGYTVEKDYKRNINVRKMKDTVNKNSRMQSMM